MCVKSIEVEIKRLWINVVDRYTAVGGHRTKLSTCATEQQRGTRQEVFVSIEDRCLGTSDVHSDRSVGEALGFSMDIIDPT